MNRGTSKKTRSCFSMTTSQEVITVFLESQTEHEFILNTRDLFSLCLQPIDALK